MNKVIEYRRKMERLPPSESINYIKRGNLSTMPLWFRESFFVRLWRDKQCVLAKYIKQ